MTVLLKNVSFLLRLSIESQVEMRANKVIFFSLNREAHKHRDELSIKVFPKALQRLYSICGVYNCDVPYRVTWTIRNQHQ